MTTHQKRGRVLLMTSVAVVVSLGAAAVLAREMHLDQRLRQIAGLQTESDARSEPAKLIEQAKQALAQNHPDVAAIFLKSALAAEPENPDLRLLLGIALFRTGDTASAERELRMAREKGAPDSKVLPILFGVMIARSEDEQLLAQFPPPTEGDTSALASDTLRARASALGRTGRLSDAAASLDRAADIYTIPITLAHRPSRKHTRGVAPPGPSMMGEGLRGYKFLDLPQSAFVRSSDGYFHNNQAQ